MTSGERTKRFKEIVKALGDLEGLKEKENTYPNVRFIIKLLKENRFPSQEELDFIEGIYDGTI